MHKNILVLGKNSYVGNVFTRYAERANTTGIGDFSRTISLSSKECNLLDGSATRKAIASLPQEPTAVIVFAVINKSAANTYQSYLDNITMIRNILDGMRGFPLTSVLYVSSVDVYGTGTSLPITEITAIAPDTWYGLAKYSAEWMMRDAKELKVPVTIARIPGVFGCAPNDRSIIGKLVQSAREQGVIRLTAEGKVRRDFVWVEDLARCLYELMLHHYDGVVNAVSGVSSTLRDIALCIEQELSLSFSLSLLNEKNERDFDLVFSNEKLKKILPHFAWSDIRVGIGSYK